MSHEIEGNYAFYASETPAWHGLGTVLKDAPSVRDAWKMAYPFEVEKHPFTIDGDERSIDSDGNVVRGIDTSELAAIVRSDGKLLSVMGKDYGLIPPYEIFSSFEPLLESGLVKLEAGGSLSNGKQIWALGKIQGGELDVLPGDTIKAYILFAASYDGSRPLLAGTTGTRVVCANTVEMADRAGQPLPQVILMPAPMATVQPNNAETDQQLSEEYRAFRTQVDELIAELKISPADLMLRAVDFLYRMTLGAN